jgi:aminopeptidase YwaD
MVADKYQDYVYNLIRKVIDEIGPRPPCGESERKLGRLLIKEWMPVCDVVAAESFTCSPQAFLGFLPLSVLAYFAAAVLYWFYPPASLVMAAVSFSLIFFEFMRYREFIDFLFPRKKGQNVIGVIRPRGEARQRVIVSAHLDSAYEFRLWYHLGTASVVLIAIAVAAVVLILGGSIAKTVAYLGGSTDAMVYAAIGIAVAGLAPIVGLFLLFNSGKPVPGAMDDMAGIAVTAGLAMYLDDAKQSDGFFPQSTEVVLLATSAEEAGLRGAKRYVKKHLSELKEKPTYGIFLDGVYDESFLTVTDRELCTGAKHDPGLVRLAQEAAASRGWPIRKSWIPLGATDASPFSLEGIPAICLHCQDTSRLVPNYHTRNDTLDYIRPESLSVTLQMVIDMIERLDGGREEQ